MWLNDEGPKEAEENPIHDKINKIHKEAFMLFWVWSKLMHIFSYQKQLLPLEMLSLPFFMSSTETYRDKKEPDKKKKKI